jgi:hypothetical protein
MESREIAFHLKHHSSKELEKKKTMESARSPYNVLFSEKSC